MAMLHQEICTVLFGRDRVRIGFRNALHYLYAHDIEFVSAWGALVGADFAFDDNAGLLREAFNGVEYLRRNSVFRHDALNDAGAVAELREQKFAALAQVVKPSAN